MGQGHGQLSRSYPPPRERPYAPPLGVGLPIHHPVNELSITIDKRGVMPKNKADKASGITSLQLARHLGPMVGPNPISSPHTGGRLRVKALSRHLADGRKWGLGGHRV